MTVDELQVLITANTNELRKEINKANQSIAGLQKSATKSTGGVVNAFKKLKTGIVALGIGKVISTAIQNGMDAIESDSLFTTVMGENADAVKSWSNEVSNALGLNAINIQKNIGVIYNMTSSMGVAGENALKMSKGVSVLAEDMASFYNLDSAEAFNKLRAGLTGETEPLKALGILVDENTVKQVAYSEGIAQNGAELTQQQKVLARYVAILKQTGNAQGDLARTLNSPANQLRQLKQQVTNLGIEFSKFLMPVISAVLPYINALTKALSRATTSLYNFFGISKGSGVSEETQKISENVGGLASGYDDATKSAKKLKNSLAGFDEMNTLQDNSSNSEGTSGGGSVGTDTGFNLGEYDAHLDWINGSTDELVDKMSKVLELVGAVAGAFALWKISKTVLDFFVNPGNLGFFKMMGELTGTADVLGALTIGDKLTSLGGAIATVAGTIALVYGVFDAWINGLDWKNFAIMIGGATVAVTGLYFAIKPFSAELAKTVGIVAGVIASLTLIVVGVKDFIKNGPTLQNTILIIGGAIGLAVTLAMGPIGWLASAIIGLVALVAGFTAAILLEEPAIMSVADAQNNLTEAKNKAREAENSYISAIDNAESAMKKLEEAEKKAGVTGQELYEQVQNGTLDYADMTDAQKEVYKAYLDNEQKQKDLKTATEELNKAKKAETIASYENQLALAKESGNYDDFKKSVIDAFEKGELSADEARELISKSMSEMGNDAQQTFMKDIPDSLKDGLDPHKYESTATKIKKWFGNLGESIKKGLSAVGDFFVDIGKKLGNAVVDAGKSAINWLLERVISKVNGFIKAINFAIGIINKIPGVEINKLDLLEVPKLARGGIIDKPTFAMVGEAGKEAVMPLERNTGWIDQLASKLGDKIGGAGGNIKLIVKLGEDAIFDKFIEYGKDKAFETNGEVVFV
jgi:hypothetical protein